MIIFWQGLGFLVAVIVFGCSLAGNLIRNATVGAGYYDQQKWPFAVSLILSGANLLVSWGLSADEIRSHRDRQGDGQGIRGQSLAAHAFFHSHADLVADIAADRVDRARRRVLELRYESAGGPWILRVVYGVLPRPRSRFSWCADERDSVRAEAQRSHRRRGAGRVPGSGPRCGRSGCCRRAG